MFLQEIYEDIKVAKSNLNALLTSIQERIGTTENWEEVTLSKISTDYSLRVLYKEYKTKEKELDYCLGQDLGEDVIIPSNIHIKKKTVKVDVGTSVGEEDLKPNTVKEKESHEGDTHSEVSLSTH